MSCSVSKDKKGFRIDYRYRGKKSSLRLGKRVNKRNYEVFASKMAILIEARNLGAIDTPLSDALTSWLNGLSDRHYEKLQQIGLCAPRKRSMTLMRFIYEYFDEHGRTIAAAEGTRHRWVTATGHARRYFGDDKMLHSVTESDAKQFRIYLLDQLGQGGRTMADATTRKMCGIISQALVQAHREGLIASNPFNRVPKGNVTNPEREVYVPEDRIDLLIQRAEEPEVKIMLALSRYGALRIPSEAQDLRWGDWDEGSNLLSVKCPKTKRHGKPSRSIPAFPKLRKVLMANKPEGAQPDDFVLPRLRLHTNPRVCVTRLVSEVGVEGWPKCFHGLRASAVTDWSQSYGLADVANWAGHTPTVAVKHYLRAQKGKRLMEFAKEIGGLKSDGNRGGDSVELVVTPMVASLTATTSQSGSSQPQPSACHGIVNDADESCLLVGVPHQQVRTRGNGRRGTRTPEGVRQQIYSLPSLPLEYPPKSNVARTAERALWHSHRDRDCITTLPLANPQVSL